jgi:hypothetical protein
MSLTNSFIDGFGYLLYFNGRTTSDVIIKNNLIRTFGSIAIFLAKSSLQLVGNCLLCANLYTAFSRYIEFGNLISQHRIIITDNYGGSAVLTDYVEGNLLININADAVTRVNAKLIYANNYWGQNSTTKIISFRSI